MIQPPKNNMTNYAKAKAQKYVVPRICRPLLFYLYKEIKVVQGDRILKLKLIFYLFKTILIIRFTKLKETILKIQ